MSIVHNNLLDIKIEISQNLIVPFLIYILYNSKSHDIAHNEVLLSMLLLPITMKAIDLYSSLNYYVYIVNQEMLQMLLNSEVKLRELHTTTLSVSVFMSHRTPEHHAPSAQFSKLHCFSFSIPKTNHENIFNTSVLT